MMFLLFLPPRYQFEFTLISAPPSSRYEILKYNASPVVKALFAALVQVQLNFHLIIM